VRLRSPETGGAWVAAGPVFEAHRRPGLVTELEGPDPVATPEESSVAGWLRGLIHRAPRATALPHARSRLDEGALVALRRLL